MKSERRILGWLVLSVALLAPSAGAQEPPPAQAPEPVQVPEPIPATEQADRPPLELSLDDVVMRALENNLTIMVEKYNPEDAAEAVREVKGVYDPFLFSNIGKTSQTNPATNIFAGAEAVETDSWVYDFGVSQYV